MPENVSFCLGMSPAIGNAKRTQNPSPFRNRQTNPNEPTAKPRFQPQNAEMSRFPTRAGDRTNPLPAYNYRPAIADKSLQARCLMKTAKRSSSRLVSPRSDNGRASLNG